MRWRLMTGWNTFFFSEEPVTAAVIWRVLLGLWTLAFFVPRAPHLEELYTAKAIHVPHPLLELLLGVPLLPLWGVQLLFLVLVACLAAFVSGWRARHAHLGVLLLLGFFYGFDISIIRGYGELSFYQWLLTWFMPYDRLLGEDGQVRWASRWGTRLVMLQFCSVYVFTVMAKLVGGDGWWDGQTLYYALKGREFGQFLLSDGWDVTRTQAMWGAWAALLTELFIAFGLWHRKTRRLAMLACVGLHGMIGLTMRVSVLFPLLMWIHLPLFWEPSGWNRWVKKWGGTVKPVEQ